MNVGDEVALLVETLTDQGNALDPDTAPKGTVVGFRGFGRVIVSWHREPPETSELQAGDVRALASARSR